MKIMGICYAALGLVSRNFLGPGDLAADVVAPGSSCGETTRPHFGLRAVILFPIFWRMRAIMEALGALICDVASKYAEGAAVIAEHWTFRYV